MLNVNSFMETYSDDELTQIIDCVSSGNLSIIRGGVLEEFEKTTANFFQTQHGLATCNGTSALFLALYALGVGRGDEVILPTYAFHAMGAVICHIGAIPVFCDINPDMLTICPIDAERKITDKTKAIMVLHPWGNVADIEALIKLRNKYNIPLISDASHAHGATWEGKPLGAYFDITAVSFGKGKLISGGELGGMFTDQLEYHEKAMLFSHVNRVPKDLTLELYKEINNAVGIKMRPHGLALKIALMNFAKFPEYFAKIRENIKKFNDLSAKFGLFPVKEEAKAGRSFWKPVFYYPEGDISSILERLKSAGIMAEKSNYTKLLHQNTIFTKYYGLLEPSDDNFPNAMRIKDCLLHIPEYLFFYKENIDFIINVLSERLKHD